MCRCVACKGFGTLHVRYAFTSQHLAGTVPLLTNRICIRTDSTRLRVLKLLFQAGNRLIWNSTVSAIQWHGGWTNRGWLALVFVDTFAYSCVHTLRC
jgi:hypothetical protein